MNFLPSNQFRKIAAILIGGGNLLLSLFALIGVFEESFDKMMIFIFLMFLVNGLLMVDYVFKLKKIEEAEDVLEKQRIRNETRRKAEANNRNIRTDREMAEQLRRELRDKASEELSIDELRELLQRKENEQDQSLHG
ncbi:MAG: hypothetical protein K6A40_04230 [Solobacterium sp.]|nr:hypothetical protein [Solobacterium sp.]